MYKSVRRRPLRFKLVSNSVFRGFFLTTIFFSFHTLAFASTNSYYNYSDVVVVVNDNSATSTTIGNYFATARGIPSNHIIHIAATSTGTAPSYVTRSYFTTNIRTPIENFLISNNLATSTNYIVLTKDVPLAINDELANNNGINNFHSVDSDLTVILGRYASFIATTSPVGTASANAFSNPYYGQNAPFSHATYGIYLVTRLDGYTISSIESMIDRSAMATTTDTGTYAFDIDPTKDGGNYQGFNDDMRAASTSLAASGHLVRTDLTTLYLNHLTNLSGYYSWGSNDANASTYTANAIPVNTYKNGAIGDTAVSTGGRSFELGTTYGQSLVADLLYEGISGVKGYVSEPLVNAMARPNILFPKYAAGDNMADSFYAASGQIAWKDIVIGDPKMVIVKTPHAPVLVSPADAAVTNKTITFTWQDSASYISIAKYQLYIDGIIAVDNLTATTTTYASSTIQGGLHSWYIKATDASSTAVMSTLRSFDILSGTPMPTAAIDVLGQSDGSSLTNPVNPIYTKNGVHDSPNVDFTVAAGFSFDTIHHRLFAAVSGRVLVFNLNSNNTLPDEIADYVLGKANFYSLVATTSQSETASVLSGLAYDGINDRLFVSDSANNRVLVFNVSTITNGMNASYVLGQPNFTSAVGTTSQSGMNGPIALAYDPIAARLFVSDQNNNRVLVFNVSTITNGMNASYVLGQPNFTSAVISGGQSGMIIPRGLAYDVTGKRLFTIENCRALVFNVATSTITNGMNASYVLGEPDFTSSNCGTDEFGLDVPRGITYDANANRLFISDARINGDGDYDVNHILSYNVATNTIANGMAASYVLGVPDFISTGGGTPQSAVSFPNALAYDVTNDRLFVSDDRNSRNLIFNVATSTIANGMDASYVLGQPDFASSAGFIQVGLNHPLTTALDTVHHRLFVTNTDRVLVFNLNVDNSLTDYVPDYVLGQPSFLDTNIPGAITQSGLSNPVGLAYDGINNRLFVSDQGNGRVLVFNVSTITNGMNASYVLGQANFTSAVGSTSQSGMIAPTGLAYSPAIQNLYVTDYTNNRVLVFNVSTITNGMNASYVLGQTNFTSATQATTQSGMTFPMGVTYDSISNRLFVSDQGNNRVLVFASGFPSFTVTQNASTTVVSPVAPSNTFTVVLGSLPSSNVVIGFTSANTSEVSVSPASLTFTPVNWSTPQVVTVSGVTASSPDGTVLVPVSAFVNVGSSAAEYAVLASSTIVITSVHSSIILTPVITPTLPSPGGSATSDYYGCTHITASNYNTLANKDDGSCAYPSKGVEALILIRPRL